jgi:hypothetical protein
MGVQARRSPPPTRTNARTHVLTSLRKSSVAAGDGLAGQQKAAAVIARLHWNFVAWRLLGRYILSAGGGAILPPFRSVGNFWPVTACIRHPMKESQVAAVVGCSKVKKVGRSTIRRNPNT